MAREEPLYFIPSEPGTIKFIVPPVENKAKHNQFMRDMERLQWLAVGHGYAQTPETWTGKFEPEEYNCVLRYLNKFGWTPAKTCDGCAATGWIKLEQEKTDESDNK